MPAQTAGLGAEEHRPEDLRQAAEESRLGIGGVEQAAERIGRVADAGLVPGT